MGGLIGSIYDLAEGNPAQHEQDQFGALGAYSTGVGEDLTTAGANFDLGILSGDPTKIAQTLAPEISSGQTQVEQQALQGANFGTRSGGTAAAAENANAAERANIINLEGGLQSGTAGSALASGGNLLGQASTDIGNQANLAEERRQQVTSDQNQIAASAAAIATGLAGGGDIGGDDPYQTLYNAQHAPAPETSSPDLGDQSIAEEPMQQFKW